MRSPCRLQCCPACPPGPAPGATVIGFVSPVAVDSLTFGQAFLDAHATTAMLLNRLCLPVMSVTVEPIDSAELGQFTFTNVPAGNYVLHIHRPGWLPRTLAVTVPFPPNSMIHLQPPDGPVFILIAGDVNGDGVVDSVDKDILMDHMYSKFGEPNYLPEADLDADGHICARDRSILFTNMHRRSSAYSGFAGCAVRMNSEQ